MNGRLLLKISLALLLPLVIASGENSAFEERAWHVRNLITHYQTADAGQEAALLLTQTAPGTRERAEALDLSADAALSGGDTTQQVEDRLTEAERIGKQLGGAPSLELSRNLTVRAELLNGRGVYRQAAEGLEQAIEIQQKWNADPNEVARASSDLAVSYAHLDRLADAVKQARRALELRSGLQPADPFLVAVAHANLGQVLTDVDAVESRAELVLALRQLEETAGPDHWLTGRAENYLGILEYHLSHYAASRPHYERALQIYEKTLPATDSRVLVLWNNYALCLLQMGELVDSRRAFEKTASLARDSLGATHSTVAAIEGNLGIVLSQLGDLSGALRVYQDALSIQEQRLGPRHQLVGSILDSMSSVHKDLGDLEMAQKEIDRAVEIEEKALGPSNGKTLQALRHRVGVLSERGRLEDARKQAEAVVQQTCSGTGSTAEACGITRKTLTDILLSLKRGPEAYEQAQQALKVLDADRSSSRLVYAEALSNVGRALELQGKHRAAADWQGRALDALPEPLIANRSTFLERRAASLAALGLRSEAFQDALLSLRVRQQLVRSIARGAPERLALTYEGNAGGELELVLRLMRSPEEEREAWNELIHSRNLVLDENATRAREERQRDASAGEWQQLSAARARLATLALLDSSRAGSRYVQDLERAQSAAEKLEADMAARSKGFRAQLDQAHLGVEEILAGLPPHTTLVAFSATDRYRAFVASSGGSVSVFDLGRAAEIDALVTGWRGEIDRERNSFGRNSAANERSYRAAAEALRRRVWDPLGTALGRPQQVFIVPDGRLTEVNFASLPVGQRSYLAESVLLHELNAERDLITAPVERHRTKTLLALGSPAYDSSAPPAPAEKSALRGTASGCPVFATLRFDPIPESGGEADGVARFGRDHGWAVQELKGAAASKSALELAVQGQEVVHLATHAFFLDRECSKTAIVREDPLLRSGLALAGANRRSATEAAEEDGILTAEEAASLDLDGTEWLVLSGCDTGTGEIHAGSGVIGLRSAFQVAGANTEIVSLWAVRDDDASRWMSALYAARFTGQKSAIDAYANANRSELSRRRTAGLSTHPFHWASFVAAGDWR